MAYRCGQAVMGRAEDPIRCKVSGNVCAHQKMCLMEGRIVLTDGALRCPARDGRMPEEPAAAPAAASAPEKPAAKTQRKAARRTGKKEA